MIGERVFSSRHGRGTIVGYKSSAQVRASRGYRGHPSPTYRIRFDSGKVATLVSTSFVRIKFDREA